MANTVSPEAAEFLLLMIEETCLPHDWDTSGLWLSHTQDLAQFLADVRNLVTIDQAAMLVGLGGMLVEMAKREREAADVVACLFERDGGAA
ncbi:hypothetical protein [Sphingomonas montanisoli]|uniref:Uncharacterized protein n=1 Tax=Sphingomonas montanisoli TaxID=2606412 RepID=A0A5D9C4F8_9SPHN|nr:hypothetical protein [Sphingomonas montanisoli]TZG25890.1 hypothetical protein FYJ91_12995 [Sphingomonas montanisoli]